VDELIRDLPVDPVTIETARIADSYASVWDAIADTRTQTEAASRCGVTQPRIDDLLRGRVFRAAGNLVAITVSGQ